MMQTRLAIVASHPIQYHGPLFRRLATLVDLEVMFAHKATPCEQARAGFGTSFDWDVDITAGYRHTFLDNIAARPGTDHFGGCDTPQIARRLNRASFDALLVMGWHLKAYVQAIVAAKRVGLPVMVRGDSHLDTPRSIVKKLTKEVSYPFLLRLFDRALYVGRRSRAYYEHYRFPQSRLFFSPHCVDNEWFATGATEAARDALRNRFGIGGTVHVALFAGKMLELKRPADLIEAAARLRADGLPIEVMVAGDGELKAGLAALAATRAVPLHLLGFCNQSEMPAAYAASDVLVLPSRHETWGLVANEAIACGRPVVVSTACGCAEDLCGEEGAGATYPVGDIDALARALAHTLKKPPPPEAFERVAHRYSVDAAARGVLNALASLGSAGQTASVGARLT